MLETIILSDNPSNLIRLHKQDIYKLIPELEKSDGFNQHNDYHIYDVLEHILKVLETVGDNYLLRIVALFHDIGKPYVFTKDEKGVGHFYGHWTKSKEIFNKYKNMFKLSPDEIELINNLIEYHDLNITKENIDFFKSLFKDNIDLLLTIKRADILAQNPKYKDRLNDLEKIEELILKLTH